MNHPKANVPIKQIKIFEAGKFNLANLLGGMGRLFKSETFLPTYFALIEHKERGLILYDCGYGPLRDFGTVPQLLFKSIYAHESASSVLKNAGIKAEEIQHIILSHFHFDHSGGLLEFPQAGVFVFKAAFQFVEKMNILQALSFGVLKHQFPADLKQRVHFIDDTNPIVLSNEFLPFQFGYDLWGDGSLIAVDLSGHAPGQAGLVINTGQGLGAQQNDAKKYFFVADACYTCQQLLKSSLRDQVFSRYAPDSQLYLRQLKQLNVLNHKHNGVQLLPSHCPSLPRKYPDLFG